METAADPSTTRLPPGTRVGPWRLLELRGQGTYGTVYRAVRADQESSAPVALKLARFSEDPRFAREVELLSRLQDPSVPRLEDSGQWQHPSGTLYPYLAMQWVEGPALYDWGRQQDPTSRQVLRLLAQLALALDATHLADGVHRDIKGANVLVRTADGQPFLIDFGVGRYQGAATLTHQVLPPGTPAYRSPEAWQFVLQAPVGAHYRPTPADDVFALGVTAYYLVTGHYPPSTDPRDEESRLWHPEGPGPQPPQALNPRCCAELSILILRMLRRQPETRGTASELAHSLKNAARRAGPEADVPLGVRAPAPAPARGRTRTELPKLATLLQGAVMGAVAAAFVFMVGFGLQRREPSEEGATERPRPTHQELKDGGSSGVADASVEGPVDPIPQPPSGEPIARELPPKPFRGQVLPEPNGRCRRGSAVPINGGCWLPIKTDLEQCEKDSYFEHKGECYVPLLVAPRPPVSSSATEQARP